MRRASTYKIYGKEGSKEELAGFCFGSGHAAEQENGIEGLKEAFGINEKNIATKTPRNVEFYKTDEMEFVLTVHTGGSGNSETGGIKTSDDIPMNLKASEWRKDDHTRFAWSKNGFGIVTSDLENVKRLHQLHDAIQKEDVALMYSGRELYVVMPSKFQEYNFDIDLDVVEEKNIIKREVRKYTKEELAENNEMYLTARARNQGRELTEKEIERIEAGKQNLQQKSLHKEEKGTEL